VLAETPAPIGAALIAAGALGDSNMFSTTVVTSFGDQLVRDLIGEGFDDF